MRLIMDKKNYMGTYSLFKNTYGKQTYANLVLYPAYSKLLLATL